ncbi:MAG: ABC transporter permease [Chloroflexi bacterium]|nr:MAG: ABC transporter permease [Chloroflexota bacterium]TMD81150.1 MAG: ABC transporter permease [Chloroflexota bacterium]
MATAITNPTEFEYAGGTVAREQVSLWRDGLRRLRRNRLALTAGIYLILLVVVGLISLVWTPYNPNRIGTCETYALPGGGHPLGCDDLGRDSLSRLMVGTQVSLAVGVATSVIVLLVGVVVGLVAGYFRGPVDAAFSLLINIFYGVPPLLVAVALYVLLGAGLVNIIIAISATVWMDMARLTRGQALSIREREFIEAARAGGARAGKIVFGHILPNALGPIIVQATFVIPVAILTAAFLSFLGFGVPPPRADWGGMANEGLPSLQGGFDPYILLWPALALSITLLAFNFFGDGLRDAFDPRQKR